MDTDVEHPAPALMPLGDHLEELRRRVILSLLVPVPVFIVCLVFGGRLLTFLTNPATEALREAGQPPRMLATNPFESLGAWIKVAAVVALLVSVPWVVYQLWLFVAPGLHKAEKRFVHLLMPLSAGLTGLAAGFLYYVMLPVSLFFLVTFGAGLVQQRAPGVALPEGVVLPRVEIFRGDPEGAPEGSYWVDERLNELRIMLPGGEVGGLPLRRGGVIAQEYRIGEYVNLVFNLGLVFAIAFQLPVVMMLLNWVGILEPRDVASARRYVVLGCAAAGALLTPQDPISMIALGGALYMLFEFGVVLMRVMPASRVAGEGAAARRHGGGTGDGD